MAKHLQRDILAVGYMMLNGRVGRAHDLVEAMCREYESQATDSTLDELHALADCLDPGGERPLAEAEEHLRELLGAVRAERGAAGVSSAPPPALARSGD